ncbi:MAG: hypothetical protein LBL65_05555 [Campylobacteraceae bacterium]|jgi:hypothetical protein|nr:hypothetical protein [Campylobacteraceae bacterium]
MITTKYKVTIEINDKTYVVNVKDPSGSEKIKLEKEAEDKLAPLKQRVEEEKKKAEIDAEIEELANALEINKELIKESKITDKLSLLLENKSLNKRIAELKKEKAGIKEIDIRLASDTLEKLNRYKFDLLISGDDKEALKTACESEGVSFTTLWEEISKEANKEYEKK